MIPVFSSFTPVVGLFQMQVKLALGLAPALPYGPQLLGYWSSRIL